MEISNLLAIGLDSDLARKVMAAGFTLSRLRVTPKHELATHFAEEDLDRLWKAIKRKPIPQDTLERLIRECDWKCCLCWDIKKESPVIIHHIVEHSKTQDDSYDNLVLLCLNHHAKAHSEWKISRSPWPPEFIRERKQKWVEAIAEFKAGLRTAPGNEPSVPKYITAIAPAPNPLFTGRDCHLNKLIKGFSSGRTVTYTIHGMGGVGKTAIVNKLAAELIPFFPGGIFWGALSDHDGNPSPVLRNWAHLCARELPFDLDADSLAHLVRGILFNRQSEKGRVLIIVDDVREKWLDSAKIIKTAIPNMASLLITARSEIVAKALDTEAHYLDEMQPGESLKLFNVYSSPYDIKDELNIAKSLMGVIGYLPLAIELAGKHLALLSRKPGKHLKALHTTVERRAVEALALPGHKGLAATFAITYESLSNEEQRIFRWLSPFAEGSLYLDEIAKIIDTDVALTERLLDSLVASSLVRWGGVYGQYTLHSLLRQYSEVLLEASVTEADEARQQHLAYYQTLTEDNALESEAAHAVLDAKLSNILKAVEFAFNSENFESVNKIVLALWTESSFLPMRVYMKLGLDLSKRAVIACQRLGYRDDESSHLSHIGTIYHHLGVTKEAFTYCNQALAISREIRNRHIECSQLNNLGLLYKDTGKIESALECFHKALDIAAEIKNSDVVLDALAGLAGAYLQMGSSKNAKRIYEDIIALSRKRNQKHREGNALSNLGLVYGDLMGLYGIAFTYFAQALAISKEIGDKTGEGNRLNHLANILLRFNQPEMSIAYLEESLEISRETGNRAHEATRLMNLGNVYRYLGRVDTAIDYYKEGLAISQELGYQHYQGDCLTSLGITYRDIGQVERARQYLVEALKLYRSTKSHRQKEVESLLSGLDHKV